MSACFYRNLLLALAGLWLALPQLVTADSTINAVLTHRETEVGEPVQLQIQIDGSSGRVQPPDVNVDGLTIQFVRPMSSYQIQMINGQITRQTTVTLLYQVNAKRPGDFTIPALAVDVDGKTYRTQPIALKVGKSSGGNSGSDDDRITFAEISISKRKAYVGEVLPAEIDLYINAETPAQVEQMPELSGEGFTKQKMPEPHWQEAHKNGHEWKFLAFRTAITPTKAGKIAVGPCDIPFVAQVPQQRGRRNPRDPFGSFMNDPFFRGFMSEPQRVTAKAPAVELEVKPLPVEGRPADFSGAVGQFKFIVEGSPNHAKIGDPVTMKVKITGAGNFDRIQAPALVDPAGWHTYPAADSFNATDDLKTTGEKTFEMPVVPETKQPHMPQFRFTYFDPGKEKYVTQTSPAIPLAVEGSAPPAPAPVQRSVGSDPAATPKTAAATPSPTDILGLHYERGPRGTFTPLYTQRGFLLVQLVPLGIAAALLAVRFLRKDSRGIRLDALRRERERLWRKLREEAGAADFYDLAVRLVQVDTALATDLEPAGIDAATARQSRPLDAKISAGLDEIFGARAELLYAGSGPVRTTLSTADRDRTIATLGRFMKAHA